MYLARLSKKWVWWEYYIYHFRFSNQLSIFKNQAPTAVRLLGVHVRQMNAVHLTSRNLLVRVVAMIWNSESCNISSNFTGRQIGYNAVSLNCISRRNIHNLFLLNMCSITIGKVSEMYLFILHFSKKYHELI